MAAATSAASAISPRHRVTNGMRRGLRSLAVRTPLWGVRETDNRYRPLLGAAKNALQDHARQNQSGDYSDRSTAKGDAVGRVPKYDEQRHRRPEQHDCGRRLAREPTAADLAAGEEGGGNRQRH